MAAETTIRIRNVPPYDGDYEFEDRPFTGREWRIIKTVTEGEVTPANITTAQSADLAIALALIALRRAGKITTDQIAEATERLLDVPLDDAHLEIDVRDGGDDGPPALTSEPAGSSPTSSLESTPPSGSGSRNGSESSASTPPHTGTSRSGTSSTLARASSTT